jgi:spermidine synthase
LSSLDISTTQPSVTLTVRVERWTRILCAVLFCSGLSALLEIAVWQRVLTRLFGRDSETVTVILTALLLGLGIGTLAGGWLSRQRIARLPLLAGGALALATYGGISLVMLAALGHVMIGASRAAMTLLVVGLLLPPSALMGAGLPILVGHLARRTGGVGSTVGLLCYATLAGAGAACLLAAALLFPFLGLQGTVNAAVAIAIAVALGTLAAHALEPRPGRLERPAGEAEAPPFGFARALAVAVAGGFVALSYAVFLLRTVSYATGASATAAMAMLGAFLIGLAVGARQAGRKCERDRGQVLPGLVLDVMLANLVGCLFLPLLGLLSSLGGGVLGVAVVMTFLVARFWGSVPAYVADLSIKADDETGLRIGYLLLATLIGAAVGAVVTGFILMDVLTLTGVYGWLVLAGLLTAALLFVLLPVAKGKKHTLTVSTAAYGLIALMATPIVNADILQRLQPKGIERSPLIAAIENRSGIITVDETGMVFGDGLYAGRLSTDLTRDTGGMVHPYALSLFHAAPRDVLMIGLASGAWAQVIANNPAVRSLTIVETNPGYMALVEQVPDVATIMQNPKVTIVVDDARRWLAGNDRHFDVIVSNTPWHFRANATNLLSSEFLRLAQAHLKPGGVLFYDTGASDRLQRNGCLVFPHGARLTSHLVVSDQPIAWDFQRWRDVLVGYRIDGRPVLDPGRASDRRLLELLMQWEASLVLGTDQGAERPIEACGDILARTKAKRTVTDDNMGGEWRYFLGME